MPPKQLVLTDPNSFLNLCALAQVQNDQGIIDGATLEAYLQQNCPPEPVSPEEFGNLTTQYIIAFLKTVPVGENGYKEMLTTYYTLENEPFIDFFETEQDNPAETARRFISATSSTSLEPSAPQL